MARSLHTRPDATKDVAVEQTYVGLMLAIAFIAVFATLILIAGPEVSHAFTTVGKVISKR